jgi:hypothetical protein
VSVEPKRETGAQNTPKKFFSRAELVSGSLVTQAALTGTIRVVATDQDMAETYSDDTITIGSTVFNTLQSWDEDATGYNFAHVCPAEAFPSVGKTTVVYFATPTGGDEFPIAWFEVDVKALPGSVTPA